jgi:hypothetical protein
MHSMCWINARKIDAKRPSSNAYDLGGMFKQTFAAP